MKEIPGIEYSVCMATYNGEKYILEQLSSILNQISLNTELIISDDGSTDSTVAIIKSLDDSRIKFVENKTGFKGPVGNFSNALCHASGEFIFLADQDDRWVEGKFDKHMELMKRYVMVVSDAEVVNDSGVIIAPSFFALRGSKSGFFNNFFKNTYLGCCMSFHSSVLKGGLPLPNYIYMHDWYIGLLAEMRGSVLFYPNQLLYYRRHSDNSSPELNQSGYSIFKKIQNRIQLLRAILAVYLK